VRTADDTLLAESPEALGETGRDDMAEG
jgi:hypothetical protein